jgi:hypothetical protein
MLETGFIWIRIGNRGGLLLTVNKPSGFINYWEILE